MSAWGSAEEFEREYAAHSGMTVEELRKRRTVRPCDCGHRLCGGWQSIPNELAAEQDAEAAPPQQKGEVRGE